MDKLLIRSFGYQYTIDTVGPNLRINQLCWFCPRSPRRTDHGDHSVCVHVPTRLSVLQLNQFELWTEILTEMTKKERISIVTLLGEGSRGRKTEDWRTHWMRLSVRRVQSSEELWLCGLILTIVGEESKGSGTVKYRGTDRVVTDSRNRHVGETDLSLSLSPTGIPSVPEHFFTKDHYFTHGNLILTTKCRPVSS